MHAHFAQWNDDTGACRMQCEGCHEAHTFKSQYFAKQWVERHSYGIAYKLTGLA